MRVDWKQLKGFIDETKLYNFINYFTLNDEVYVWMSYQNENFSCLLYNNTIEYEEFIDDYKDKAILKDDIEQDGIPIMRNTHVITGRIMHAIFAVIKTSTKNNNDKTGYITVKLFDSNGNETDLGSEAVKTAIDFETNFSYELSGGGIQCLSDLETNFYVSAVMAPDIPSEMGGSVYNVINKFLVLPKEDIFVAGIGPGYMTYTEGSHTNKLRIEISHDKGIEKKFQTEVQYYS